MNEDRKRYYGLRIGDKVVYGNRKCEVIGFMNNNSVVLSDGIEFFEAIAEHCIITKKVEEND